MHSTIFPILFLIYCFSNILKNVYQNAYIVVDNEGIKKKARVLIGPWHFDDEEEAKEADAATPGKRRKQWET